MDFPPELQIKNVTYTYVDTQRDRISAIYKSLHAYLRIGQSEKMLKDLTFHKRMENYGFPVPKILDEGVANGLSFFIEESLGDKHLGYIFRDEVQEYGKIQEESFKDFVNVCTAFARAQLQTTTNEQNWESFRQGVMLDSLCKELPHDADTICHRFGQIEKHLSELPFALNHGDLTPFNMYPDGVIDFEDSFVGPVGYDLGALIEHLNWFPDDSQNYEFYRHYNFSHEQKQMLITELDTIYIERGLPKLSGYLADLDFAKGIWFAVKLDRFPKLQEFRFSLIKELMA